MKRHVRNLILVLCFCVTISFVTFSYAAFSQELMITGGEAVIEAQPDKRLATYITELVNKTPDVERIGNAVRYVGNDPKNYVHYNGETWRIVGVFDTQTETGSQKLVKLKRMDPVEIMSWDGGADNQGNGKNDYSTSRIRNYLFYNFYYKSYDQYNRFTCYNGNGYNHTFQCDYKGLTVTAASMVEKVYWNLGSTNPYVIGEQDVFTPEFLMQSENSNARPNVCNYGGWNSRCSETGTRPSSVLDYIGLSYASDIGFASGGVCASRTMSDWCHGEAWLAPPGAGWTISPAYSRDYADTVVGMYYGMLWTENASVSWGVRPTLYLKNEVVYQGGTGTASDPILLGYDGVIGIDTPTQNYAPQGEDVSTGGQVVIPDPPDPGPNNGKYSSTQTVSPVENWANHYNIDFTVTNKYGRDLTDWTITIYFKNTVRIADDTQVHVLTKSEVGQNYIKINSLNQYYSGTQHTIPNNGSIKMSDLGNIILSLSYTDSSITNINDIISSIELKDSRDEIN